jgi:hypothetical protein
MPDYAALKAEVANDPLALGYAGKTNQQVADLMNGADRSIQSPRFVVDAWEVWEAIVPADWAALTTQEKQRVQTILGMGRVNLAGTNTRASLAAAFAAGTPTRTNLTALQTQTVPRSRAQEIFGMAVTDQDILAARSR